MKCGKCGETAGDDYRPMGIKYAAHEVVYMTEKGLFFLRFSPKLH